MRETNRCLKGFRGHNTNTQQLWVWSVGDIADLTAGSVVRWVVHMLTYVSWSVRSVTKGWMPSWKQATNANTDCSTALFLLCLSVKMLLCWCRVQFQGHNEPCVHNLSPNPQFLCLILQINQGAWRVQNNLAYTIFHATKPFSRNSLSTGLENTRK